MMEILKRCLLVALLLYCTINLSSSQSVDDVLQMGQDAYKEEKNKPVKLPPQNSKYDFIIVGAGPAGCVLANRLSENPNWTVFLIEAGGTENIVNDWPVLAANLQLTEANWNYKSTPQKKACLGMRDNKCALPRGKMVGGTSGINLMLYTRGNREDFDRMAEAGNYGWSYEEVLPYYLRSEKANLMGLENSPYHNRSGLQSVEDVKYRTRMAEAFVRGSVSLGYREIDYNGESQLGTAYVQATTLNGHRHTAAKAFVLPILEERTNLHLLTFATVTQILIDDETLSAYGVKFVHRAGAFNSPQLLLLSGIGPNDALESVGIEQVVDFPVGKIMYEHMSHFGPTFLTNSTGATLFSDRITDDDKKRYRNGDPSTRISTVGNIEALGFMKLPNSHYQRPDIEFNFVSGSFASDYGKVLRQAANIKDDVYSTTFAPLERKEHCTIVVIPFHPKSTGKLWLADSNPFTPPMIDPNYFDDEYDIDVALAGIKEAIRIAETAMKRINATLHTINVPVCENFKFGTDDYWRCSIKVLSYTVHHQVGSCKMGRFDDSTAVVSPELKVYGIRKLRVGDTSVLPFPLSAHTNAPSIMIGEKLSAMIISDWKKM